MNQYINFIESDIPHRILKRQPLYMLYFYTKVLQSIYHDINILYSNSTSVTLHLQNKDQTKEGNNDEFCPANQDSSYLYAWRYQ